MPAADRTIYADCRNQAGKTIEEAAFLLNVSPRQLARYETTGTDAVTPPDDVVAAMVQVYNTPYLAYLHSIRSPVTRTLLPGEVGCVPLINAVAKLNVAVSRYMAKAMEAQAVALDGAIQPNEQALWDEVSAMVNDIYTAALEVRFSKGVDKP